MTTHTWFNFTIWVCYFPLNHFALWLFEFGDLLFIHTFIVPSTLLNTKLVVYATNDEKRYILHCTGKAFFAYLLDCYFLFDWVRFHKKNTLTGWSHCRSEMRSWTLLLWPYNYSNQVYYCHCNYFIHISFLNDNTFLNWTSLTVPPTNIGEPQMNRYYGTSSVECSRMQKTIYHNFNVLFNQSVFCLYCIFL